MCEAFSSICAEVSNMFIQLASPYHYGACAEVSNMFIQLASPYHYVSLRTLGPHLPEKEKEKTHFLRLRHLQKKKNC